MTFNTWISSSFKRHFPHSSIAKKKRLTIDTALNERCSFQVVLRQETGYPQEIAIEVQAPDCLNVRIRRVGYVPVLQHNTPILGTSADTDGFGHIPGYVPDPLFDENSLCLPSHETHAFWISVTPKSSAKPGNYPVSVSIIPSQGHVQKVAAEITLHAVKLKKRKEFHITHWFYADALIDYYKTDQFDERFWEILVKYFKNMVEHGQDTILIPIFTPPLDGVKTPSQLLNVHAEKNGKYSFDWSDVKRYVDLAKKSGFSCFEWSHLFTQWGVYHAIRIYEGQGKDKKLLWPADTGATSAIYHNFMSQFLPEFHAFLKKEKLLNKSFFHVSDEPHGEAHLANYVAARNLLKELAPWMKVMDALSDYVFADKTDMPIPTIKSFDQFVANKVDCWCYYCCGPRQDWLNRLMDTPLAKIAMHGFLFYRWPAKGFLHWGYNYWYKSQTRQLIDPFIVSDGERWPGWAHGDPFEVYPGENGPIDSIRWEIFAESLQDYALLQTLKVNPDDSMFASLRSYRDFPKTEQWRRNIKRKLLMEASL